MYVMRTVRVVLPNFKSEQNSFKKFYSLLIMICISINSCHDYSFRCTPLNSKLKRSWTDEVFKW